MKKIFYILFIIFSSIFFMNFSYADDNIENIYKIESYSYDSIIDSFILEQYGSSIYVDDGLIYTNAHVILDENNEPFGNYRVCKTLDFKENAKCFSVGKLLYFDRINDLAVLRVIKSEKKGVDFSKKNLNIGDIVKVYGYPSNGGDTITYTEGKISGYEKGLYKIDANFDAGNSGGGIFDSDGNLIGMAVSVGIGYSTLGYIIPLEKINNFIEEDGENIEYDDNSILDSFLSYTLTKNKVIGANSLDNDYILLDDIKSRGFLINNYLINNSKDNFSLELSDKNNETNISLTNITIQGNKSLDFEKYFDSNKDEIEDIKKQAFVKKAEIKKLKLKNKDTMLGFIISDDNEIHLMMDIEISENNILRVEIISSNLKNKSFINGIRLVLKNLEFKENTKKEDENEYIPLNNLKLKKIDGFYLFKDVIGSDLENFGDITVVENSYEKENVDYYMDDTDLTYILESSYDILKDDYYLYEYLIGKTDNGENYIYQYGLNNKTKSSKLENKEVDKYFVNAFFYDKIDEDNFYYSLLSFSFNDKASKKEIDELLKTIKTTSGEGFFPVGNLKELENIVR